MWCRRYGHGDCITEVSVEEPYDLEDLREHIRNTSETHQKHIRNTSEVKN
jgi:hypothetical protein